MGISVREAERCLDADVFLDEHPRWPPLGSHCQYIMHQMFAYAKAMGQLEHNQGMCQGQGQPSPKWDLGVKPSAMELVGPEMIREEF